MNKRGPQGFGSGGGDWGYRSGVGAVFPVPAYASLPSAQTVAHITSSILNQHFITQPAWSIRVVLGHQALTTKRFLMAEAGKLKSDQESAENNRMMGLALQGQGQLDLAFDHFCRVPMGDSTAELSFKISKEQAPDIRVIRTELPESLAHLVALSRSKLPELRYQNGNQFAADLHAICASAPPQHISEKTNLIHNLDASKEPDFEETVLQSGLSGRLTGAGGTPDTEIQ